MRTAVLPLLFMFVGAAITVAQISPDPQILAEVNRIPAVDNHTHVMKVVGPGEKDDDFDALPCDPLEPSEMIQVQRQSARARARTDRG